MLSTHIQLSSVEPDVLRIRTLLAALRNDLSRLNHLLCVNYDVSQKPISFGN
jgi:hypothetical protein